VHIVLETILIFSVITET